MHKGIKNKSRLYMGLKKARADLTEAKFIFYHGPTQADSAIYELDDNASMLEHRCFDKSKNTVLYLHGYLEDPNVESIRVIVNAYLKRRNDTNLIVLDWGDLADGNYAFDAFVNVKQLGPYLAKKFLEMFENGLDNEKLHIVGHSLGGQLAGVIGREVHKRSHQRKKVKRITALDPAFPLFYYISSINHLNKHDAEFVDIIHTDAWIYGAPVSSGTADFWPNSGKTLQPGCPKRNYKMLTDNDLCSHRRSWWFWAESVANNHPEKFEAVKAKNWSDFKNGKHIDCNVTVVMGHDCPTHISGKFFLQTNGISPYARGKSGTVYVPREELIGHSYEECQNSNECKESEEPQKNLKKCQEVTT